MHALQSVGFPPRRYAATLVFQTVVVWLGVRFLLAMPLAWAGADVLRLRPLSALLVVAACAALVRLDGRRQREHLFQGNLGTAPHWLTGIPLASAAALEFSVRAVAG